MSNLQLRLASTAVLLPTVIAAFVAGGWWSRGLVLAAAAAAFFEFGAVVAKSDLLARALLLACGVFVTFVGIDTSDAVAVLLSIQVSFFVLAALFVLRPGPDLVIAARQLGMLVFSLAWIAPGMICLGRLRELGDTWLAANPGKPEAAAACFLLVAMIGTWANDTAAYFAGRFLGKHKMAGAISPKKTWEGFVGGMFGPPVFLVVGRALFPDTFAPMTTMDIVIVSIPCAVLGPVGDLCESLWKRAYDVKDSGNLIPGHGGMLDRVDAVFFVTPWVLGYFVIIKPMLTTFFG